MADNGVLGGDDKTRLPMSVDAVLVEADQMAALMLLFMDCLNRQSAVQEVLAAENNPRQEALLEQDLEELNDEHRELWAKLSAAIGSYHIRAEQLRSMSRASNAQAKVAVPVQDLVRLEDARAALWKMFPNPSIAQTVSLSVITGPIWRVGNQKYPSTFDLGD